MVKTLDKGLAILPPVVKYFAQLLNAIGDVPVVIIQKLSIQANSGILLNGVKTYMSVKTEPLKLWMSNPKE
jgi:hypothetical protein